MPHVERCTELNGILVRMHTHEPGELLVPELVYAVERVLLLRGTRPHDGLEAIGPPS